MKNNKQQHNQEAYLRRMLQSKRYDPEWSSNKVRDSWVRGFARRYGLQKEAEKWLKGGNQ